MKRHTLTILACLTLGALASLSAQDLTITNARIIVANGAVIERGSIVVRAGKIVSVAAGAPSAAAGKTIDAKGMTAMPGFIDAHRHINTGPNEKAQMQALLEAGYTTILSGGGPAEGNITLRDHIDKGLINGPRIIPSGSIAAGQQHSGDGSRRDSEDGRDGHQVHGRNSPDPDPGAERARNGSSQGHRRRGQESRRDGPGPCREFHGDGGRRRRRRAAAGSPPQQGLGEQRGREEGRRRGRRRCWATVGFGSPVFGVFADDNKPRFRDGKPWPEGIVDGVRLGEEAGYMPVNARTIWDAGAILGYCTDTTYDPTAGLDHELKILNVMFSMQDLVKMMGPNTASYIQMGDQLGTLEPGKLADIILLDGDPLEGYWNWLKTKVVVKGGVIVVDKR